MIKSKIDIDMKTPMPNYPRLMKNVPEGRVILFRNRNSGMVVVPDKSFPVGHFSNSWDENYYGVFNSTVTLENC